MSCRVGGCIGALLLAALTTAPNARAEGSETDVAAQFFEAGVAAAKKGEFRVCAEAFTEAHKRAPHGATLYNAALCWEGAKNRARAANDFARALKLANLSEAQAKQARSKLSELAATLGKLELAEPKGVRATVGPIEQKPIPFETFVEPGEQEVKLEGPEGEIITRTVSVEAGQHKLIKLEGVTVQPDQEPKEKPKGAPLADDSSGSLQRTAGWILIGVSAAAVGAGVGYYVSALGSRDKFEDSKRTNATARSDAIDRYSIARALWIGAGVGAAAGVTLVLIAPKKGAPDASAKLRLHLAPSHASASWAF
ncbi:MAG: hypothetical protein IPI67_18260 [Myxococcales bacterium]|nr:hypothetical protein [Myxococcales bacterium]